MRRALAAGIGALAALFPGTALALGPVDVGVSALTLGGYNAIDKGGSPSFTAGERSLSYPGFGGPSLGGGLALEVRALGLIGIEVDGIFSRDRGDGSLGQATVDIGQNAVHIPVLLKGVAPLPGVRPFLVAGPEFVLPLPSRAESEPPGAIRAVVGTERSTMLTGGLGGEVKFPLPSLDLRASFFFRGSYRAGSSGALAERVTPLPSGALILDGRWRYQALLGVSLGVFF
jgi:hypothetical protein